MDPFRSSSTVEQAAVKDLIAVTRLAFLNSIEPLPRPPVPFLTAVGMAGRRFRAIALVTIGDLAGDVSALNGSAAIGGLAVVTMAAAARAVGRPVAYWFHQTGKPESPVNGAPAAVCRRQRPRRSAAGGRRNVRSASEGLHASGQSSTSSLIKPSS